MSDAHHDENASDTPAGKESERLAVLRSYDILNTSSETGFDDIVLLASEICDAPIALISFVDFDRQWFKARVGFDLQETPLDQSICRHALDQAGVLIIPDLTADPRTAGNPLVTGARHLRFYAAVRLASPDGAALGTLCIEDTVPRPRGLAPSQEKALLALGRQIMALLELRRTSEERRAGEDFVKSVLASSDDCIKVLELDGTIVFMSEGGQRVMEVSDFNDIRGCPWPTFWTGANNAIALAAVEAAKAGGVGHFQGQADTMAGTPRWWDVRVTPILNGQGRPERLLSVSRDITLARSADARRQALLDLSDRLRDMDDPSEMAYVAAEIMGLTLHATRAGFGTIDPTGETIVIDRDWTAPGHEGLAGALMFRNFGDYGAELKQGRTVVITNADVDARTASRAARLTAIGARSLINLPLMERSRLVAVFYVNDAEARNWSQEDVAFVRNVADRTRAFVERRRAEDGLRHLNEDLERRVAERTRERDRVWRNSQDLMVVIDWTGVFHSVSPAVATILGWSPEEMIGRTVFDFIHPDDVPSTDGALEHAKTGPLPSYLNRYRHKDGTYRPISWVASPEDDMIYAYGRDVSKETEAAQALKDAEGQLRQAQKMEAVGQLTGGLAHDFNNLLAGISGSLELMQVRISQGRMKDVERYISAAQGAASRAAALTHRLLAFSRRQTLDPKATNVARLVSGMEELIRRTVGPSIGLEVVGTAGLWSVLVDPPQLENALLNLCINARDAMPDGGRITIETHNKWLDERAARERDLSPGQYLSLCVSDAGTGMSADVIAKAFDPFFTTKPIGEGTGLGLSMIYGFAKQSGGQVRIYSEVGEGTNVCIYLPRHYADEAQERDASDLKDPPRADEGEIVLVVDDEPTVRMLVAEVLEDLGYTAIEAVDSVSGLKILQSDVRIDLLVTDVGLPGGMNGRQMADAGMVKRPDLKVLFITGYAENAALNNGHLRPGMQVVTKPFAMEALATRIRSMIIGD